MSIISRLKIFIHIIKVFKYIIIIKAGLAIMKQNDFVSECNRILGKYWEIIVIAVAAVILFLFGFYYIISNSRWGFYSEVNDDRSVFADSDNAAVKKTVKDGKADDVKNKRRAYLTFDDGPSENTIELLDVLDEYNVKATFFVIGRDESYYDKYRAIVDRGHVLALHSYSHDYNKIYASKDNFVKDIEELRKLLYDVTGEKPIYYRFPGGSSNSVTKVDTNELIEYLDKEGLVYFDWNALNEDAVSGNLTPKQLVDNIMKDARLHDDVVILMHDLKERHSTIESLPLLIENLQDEGYEILPIDENTPLIRHKIKR